MSRKREFKENFGTRLHGNCQWNLLITLNRKEMQVIIIQEVQVDRQVPKGGAAKRGHLQSQPINHTDKKVN